MPVQNSGGTQVLSSQMVQQKVSSSNSDLKNMTKSFYDTMKGLMADFANPNKNMVINGVPVAASEKYGIVGTLLIGEAMSDSSKAIETLMNFQTTIFNLEKKLTAKGA